MDAPPPRPTPAPPDTSKVSLDAREVVPVFGLGRAAPFARVRTVERNVIEIYWGKLGLWCLALAVVGWTAASAALYAYVKYNREFTEVRYSHMLLLPWKLAEYRRAKGEFLVRQGLRKAEEQDWRNAFDLLRTGLHNVPEHREARLMTARIYMMAGRQDAARETLIAGLQHHGDQLDYLREVLGYLFALQADETVIAVAKELLTKLEPKSPAARVAHTAIAYAHFNRSRYAQAEAALEQANLVGTPEGRFVFARIAWDRGHREEALAGLRLLVAKVPDDDEIYRTLGNYLREARRWSELRSASLERQLALPDRPEGYVDFIQACSELGDTRARGETEAAFLARFSDNPTALLKLSELASRIRRVDLAATVARRCRDLSAYEPEAVFQWLSAQIAERAFPDALATWNEWAPRSASWNERQRVIFGALRGIALYGAREGNEAQALVRKLYDTRLTPPSTLTALGLLLEQVGQPAEARRVWRQASDIDPLHQPALVNLLRQDIAESQLEDASDMVIRLAELRRPPRELFAELFRTLDSDLFLFNPRREPTRQKLRALLGESAAH